MSVKSCLSLKTFSLTVIKVNNISAKSTLELVRISGAVLKVRTLDGKDCGVIRRYHCHLGICDVNGFLELRKFLLLNRLLVVRAQRYAPDHPAILTIEGPHLEDGTSVHMKNRSIVGPI